VHDRYRCPEEFLDFRLSCDLSLESGYFQFGVGTTCYGRFSKEINPTQLSSQLVESLQMVKCDGKQVLLPFDPTEIIDNLRLERYLRSQLRAYEHVLKSLYYRLRPITNRSLRKQIQRLRAAHWQERQFPSWPVDTTVESICENLLVLTLRASGVDRIPFIWFWPDGARGCVSMSHDVEAVAGRNFCAQLMDIDDSFGFKSSFQIVPEDRYPVSQEFLTRLRDRGFEVCVQDLNHDGRLFDERNEFLRRVAKINRYGQEYGARGFRSAVLYRNPDWYKDLDFAYDMSMPNVAHLDPQKGGCCTVMPYFIGNLLELPLTTVQDYTLFHVLGKRSIDLWKTQLGIILAKNGMASFIVHPDYIAEPEPRALYIQLLNLLKELRIREALWFALPGEVDRWWRARNRLSIVSDRDGWRIVGEGAERAVLAFAKLENNQLTYELAEQPHVIRR